jgi:hypothetical protein
MVMHCTCFRGVARKQHPEDNPKRLSEYAVTIPFKEAER